VTTTTDNWFFSAGWLSAARRVDSPNYNPRPASSPPALIVVHGISLPPGCYGGGEIESFFCNTLNADDHPYFGEIIDLRVSAHFFGLSLWRARAVRGHRQSSLARRGLSMERP
jgi:hypothetical protein